MDPVLEGLMKDGRSLLRFGGHSTVSGLPPSSSKNVTDCRTVQVIGMTITEAVLNYQLLHAIGAIIGWFNSYELILINTTYHLFLL